MTASRFPDAPGRIRTLPVDARGFPVPWFVAWIDGVPDFRVVDTRKFKAAMLQRRCWICGEPLGRFVTSVIGPMCTITRSISEPPMHRECAHFAAVHCPFLSNPMAKRREGGLPDAKIEPPGLALKGNPSVCAVWTSTSIKPFREGDGFLFQLQEPTSVEWFAHGRPATRAEVDSAIQRGLPALWDLAAVDGAPGKDALQHAIVVAAHWLPPEVAA